MADIARARVPVVFDKAQIAADANDAITGGITAAATNAAKLIAGIAVGRELVAGAKAGLTELIDQEKVAAQTTIALRTASNITQQDIEDLGQSMLDLAGFDDEAAKSAANILLRFGAIHDSGTLKRIEGDAADLAITMGTDLPSAAQTLGRILQAPELAARLLRPIIGALTDAQTASIKSFTDAGNAAGAQGVILQVLEERIGGAAAAYGDKLGGALDKASENIKNAKASLVEGLAPALEKGSDLVSGFARGVEGLPGPLREVVSVGVGAGVAIFGLAQPIAGLIGSFSALKAARLLSAAAATVDTEATVAETGALAAEAGVLTAVTGAAATAATALAAVALAAAPIAVIGAEVYAAWKILPDLFSSDKLSGQAITDLGGIAARTDEQLKSLFLSTKELSSGEQSKFFDSLVNGGQQGLTVLQRLAAVMHGTGYDTQQLDAALATATTRIAGAGQAAALTAEQITALDKAISDQAKAEHDLAGVQLSAESATFGVADAQARLRDAQREATIGIADQQRALASAVTSASEQLRKAQQAADEVTFAQQRAHLAASEAEAEITLKEAERAKLRARTVDESYTADKNLIAAKDGLAKSQEDVAGQAQKELDAHQAVADAANALYDAQVKQAEFADTLVDKQRAVAEAELGVRQAVLNQADALTNLKVAQDAANGVTDTEAQKTETFRTILGNLATDLTGPTHDALVGYVNDLAELDKKLQDLLDRLPKAPGTAADILSGLTGIPFGPPHKALGGPVVPGEIFRGAEKGFEILAHDGIYNAGIGGTVLTHEQSVAALTGRGGPTVEAGAIQVTMVGASRHEVRAVVDELAFELVS